MLLGVRADCAISAELLASFPLKRKCSHSHHLQSYIEKCAFKATFVWQIKSR